MTRLRKFDPARKQRVNVFSDVLAANLIAL
jgi:hypothetical protein